MSVLDPQVVQAVKAQNTAGLVSLIQNGHSIEGTIPVTAGNKTVERTALSLATRKQSLKIVNILLDAGADPSVPESDGTYPVSIAALGGFSRMIPLFFIYGASLEEFTPGEANRPLAWAAQRDHLHVMRELLALGASVDARSHMDRTALWWAAKSSESPEAIPLLLDYGAIPRLCDTHDATPLHAAASNPGIDPNALLSLLDAGADLRALDGHDKTALEVARDAGNERFIEPVTRYNIYDPNRSRDCEEVDPRAREQICEHVASGDMLRLRETLSQHSFVIQPTEDASDSPSFQAVAHKNHAALRLFSTLQLFNTDRDVDLNTPVHAWVEMMDDRNPVDLTTLKHMTRGFGVNHSNRHGRTPADLAEVLGKFGALATCLVQGGSLSGLEVRDSHALPVMHPHPAPRPGNTLARGGR